MTSASPTVVVSGLNKGDVVDVQATLTTTESGEIAESTIDGLPTEPLVLQSTGGFSFTVPVYGQPLATRFTATTDGESLSAFIQNYDFDESGSVTVTVNSTAQQILSQTVQNLLTKVVAEQNVVASGAATALADCLSAGPVEPCATLFASLSSATMLASQVQAQLALDAANRTPDPNFTQIQQPVVKTLSDIPAEGMTADQALAANTMLVVTETLAALGQSLQTAANRAQSAADVGDVVAAQQQAEALQAQMELYSKLLAAQSAALKQIQGAFATPSGLLRARASRARAAQAASDGFAPQTVTQDEVFDFELGVANNGLPDPIREDLAQLGATNDQVDMIRQVAMVQDPEAVAGAYPARMADQTLIDDLSAAAASLRADLPPAIGHLIEAVKALNLPAGIPNGLLSKLTAAQQALDAHSLGGVCNQLGSFISQVSAQRGKKIRTADANALIDEARAVSQRLGCGGA